MDFDDETTMDFTAFGRADLPDASQIQDILYNSDTNDIGRVILLGKYFDAKYPDNQINADFSNDVAVIFPELSQQEVYDRTSYIRHAVNLYRWGMKKYNDIKAKIAAPEEPPLIADDDEYDNPENYTYIQTEPNQTAVVYDFKKVLSYGNNPRDLKAIEAKKQRAAESKKHKTAFDKFKSMVGKLEFSKLPFYGITLPNPLVGNAGVGEWIYQDGFKARLLSEFAQIKSVDKFLGALHISVPQHRFMLANSLSENLQKPRIIFEEMQNIKSYKVYFPVPISVLSDTMIAGYVGDFAFPIKFETMEADKPVSLKAKIVFNGCDTSLDCSPVYFLPEVQIETGKENESSGVQNFIRQSFYNLPQNNDKNFKLNKTSLTFKPDSNEVRQLQFVFSFKGNLNNFAMFIDDNQYTEFTRPSVTVNGNLIYVTSEPLNNTDKLLNTDITVTARLNNYTAITQNVKLVDNKPDLAFGIYSFATMLQLSFFIGVLFNLLPIGLGFLMLTAVKASNNKIAPFAGGIFMAANLICLLSDSFFSGGFIWGMQYTHISYMTLIVLCCILLLTASHYVNEAEFMQKNTCNLMFGALVFSCLPLYNIPFAPEVADYLSGKTLSVRLLIANLTALGVIIPYLLLFIIKQRSFFSAAAKYKVIILSLASLLILLTAAILAGRIILQLSVMRALKFVAFVLIIWFAFDYLFRFLQALQEVSVPQKHKNIARNIIVIIFGGLLLSALTIGNADIDNSLPVSDINQKISEQVAAGNNVIVAIEPKWCFRCKINKLLTFNEYNLSRWSKDYKLEYISIADYNSDMAASLLKNHQISLPAYILFNYKFENGINLSSLIDEASLQQILDDY